MNNDQNNKNIKTDVGFLFNRTVNHEAHGQAAADEECKHPASVRPDPLGSMEPYGLN